MNTQSNQIAAARLEETRRVAEHPERQALRELRAFGALRRQRRTEAGRRRSYLLPRPLRAAARDLI